MDLCYVSRDTCHMLTKAKNAVLDLIFPKHCAGCQSEGVLLCDICKNGLYARMLTPTCPICSFRNGTGVVCKPCRKKTALSRLVAAFPYQEKTVRELLHIYKYNRAREAGPICAEFLIAHARQWHMPFPRTAIIIPIPLHSARMRERGFNQSEEIGKLFAASFKLSYRGDILQRTKYVQSQVACADFRERRKNITGVFTAHKTAEIQNKTIVLVDDITTSGSTMNEAARILKEAGAKSIWGVVIARG